MGKQFAGAVAAGWALWIAPAAILAASSFQQQVVQYHRAAEARFSAQAVRPKEIGMTVCSADNRLGYVEQIAGPRIKVDVRAVAAAEAYKVATDRDPMGPFETVPGVDVSLLIFDPQTRSTAVPVADPHYLFQELPQLTTLPFNNPKTVWGQSSEWAVCTWTL